MHVHKMLVCMILKVLRIIIIVQSTARKTRGFVIVNSISLSYTFILLILKLLSSENILDHKNFHFEHVFLS